MTKLLKFTLSLFTLFMIIDNANAQKQLFPIIKNYGGVYDIKEATVKPDTSLIYNIAIEIKSPAENNQQLSEWINNVARMINLHAVGGVPANHLNVVVIFHGKASDVVMNDEAYHEKYMVSNPNRKIIEELKAANVKLIVCGQSLIGRKIPVESLLKEVDVATSFLTTITTYQLKGYAHLTF
ncbi:MAG: DsrE family protein [Daejeonella sp.]